MPQFQPYVSLHMKKDKGVARSQIWTKQWMPHGFSWDEGWARALSWERTLWGRLPWPLFCWSSDWRQNSFLIECHGPMALGKIASIPGLCCHSDPHCLVALLWLCFIFRVVLGKPGFLLLSWLWEEVLQVLILLVERLCLFLPLTERAAPLVLDIICALNSTSLQDTDTVTFFFFLLHTWGWFHFSIRSSLPKWSCPHLQAADFFRALPL